eukprot:TRINITY_DN41397_c0_g1_i1.p1 TRINITY_DN41397_c0_g1~~TRINITY_DN41397_c0_g1_i1.p1  ORF type:complete len:142 (+),score=3.89 TRINITY_DN41397_c0_g1_i1:87-512(+)
MDSRQGALASPEGHFLRGALLINHLCVAIYIGRAIWGIASSCKAVMLAEQSDRTPVMWLQGVRDRLRTGESGQTKGIPESKVHGLVSQRRVARTIVFARHGLHIWVFTASMCTLIMGWHAFNTSWLETQAPVFIQCSLFVD